MELFFNEDIPEKPRTKDGIFWKQGFFNLGTQKRTATVTDVKFVDETLLIVAHRAAAKLYLLEKDDNGDYNQVHSIVLMKESGFFHPDLITVKDYKVYITEFTNILAIVNIDKTEKSLTQIKALTLNKGKYYHGCSHDINSNYIYLGGVNIRKTEISLFHTQTQEFIHIPFPIKTRIKSLEKISMDGKDYLIVGIDNGKKQKQEASIVLCELDISVRSVTIIDILDLPPGQIDGMTQNQGNFYFCVHIENYKGYIYKYHIENAKIKFDKSVEVLDFPHGIDIMGDSLVYCSYATSSIKFLDMNDFY